MHIPVLECLVPLLRPRPLDSAVGVGVGGASIELLRGAGGPREVGDEGVAAGGLPEKLVGHQPRPKNLHGLNNVSYSYTHAPTKHKLSRKMKASKLGWLSVAT
jgi:hypothetical protein